MKIVCINNTGIDPGQKTQNLTIGKIYETNDILYPLSDNVSTTLEVMNDKGEIILYKSKRFITLEEWRESKLIKIGI